MKSLGPDWCIAWFSRQQQGAMSWAPLAEPESNRTPGSTGSQTFLGIDLRMTYSQETTSVGALSRGKSSHRRALKLPVVSGRPHFFSNSSRATPIATLRSANRCKRPNG